MLAVIVLMREHERFFDKQEDGIWCELSQGMDIFVRGGNCLSPVLCTIAPSIPHVLSNMPHATCTLLLYQ